MPCGDEETQPSLDSEEASYGTIINNRVYWQQVLQSRLLIITTKSLYE